MILQWEVERNNRVLKCEEKYQNVRNQKRAKES